MFSLSEADVSTKMNPSRRVKLRHSEPLLDLFVGFHHNVEQTKLELYPLSQESFPDHRERSVRRKPIGQSSQTE